MQLACSGYCQKQLIGSVGRVPRFSDNIVDRGSELRSRSSCFRGALKLIGCNASRRRNKVRSDDYRDVSITAKNGSEMWRGVDVLHVMCKNENRFLLGKYVHSNALVVES